jgi:hypothetical protein
MNERFYRQPTRFPSAREAEQVSTAKETAASGEERCLKSAVKISDSVGKKEEENRHFGGRQYRQ